MIGLSCIIVGLDSRFRCFPLTVVRTVGTDTAVAVVSFDVVVDECVNDDV